MDTYQMDAIETELFKETFAEVEKENPHRTSFQKTMEACRRLHRKLQGRA